MPNPAACTEAIDQALTLGTFRLYVQSENGVEQEVGNIVTGGFQHTPNVIQHRRGIDNSIDAQFVTGRDYIVNFTTDRISAFVMKTLLNEDAVNVDGGCEIPLQGSRCVREYGMRLLHFFPCGDEYAEITFWRASILGDFTLNFEREEFATVQGTITALACESAHPNQIYGKVFFNDACPAS
jgi:hypothetical protein